jgi:hypothetical protein
MPTIIDRSLAPAVLRFTATGVCPTVAELDALCHAEITAGALTASTRALIDLRGVTEMPSLEAIQKRANQAINEHAWPLRRAYVVQSGAQYGVVRQMQALSPTGIQIQIFTDEGPALTWLLGDANA